MNAEPDCRPTVVVLIVCHDGAKYLRDCLSSVLASDDGDITRHVVVVDNASQDDSRDLIAAEFPQVDLIVSPRNLGFSGGNNLGWQYAGDRYPDVQYLALLNQDTVVASGWLTPMVAHLESHPLVAAAQAKIRLHPQTEKLNTAGNRSHYLGFGFTSGYGQIDHGQYDQVRSIDFPSGAAVMLRTDVLRRHGLFDASFFNYLEDADLGWKLRQLSYRLDFLPTSVVWHKYEFDNHYGFYFHLERNRWMMLATYYKLATLLLLLPALILMEAGQFYFAWRHGVLNSKLRAMAFFLDRRNLAFVSRRRGAAQRRRLIGDRRFAGHFTGRVEFPELRSPLLQRVANPLLAAYWAVVRHIILW